MPTTAPPIDDGQLYREAPPSRIGFYAAIAVAAVLFAYWASPYVAAVTFARAAQTGPDAAVISRIDIASLRNSFARQIVRAYVARSPQTRDLDRLSRTAVNSVAAGYVSGIIGDYLTPEVIAELLRTGRSTSSAQSLLGEGTPLPRVEGLQQAWTLFAASGFTGLTLFRVDTTAVSGAGGYGLVFGLGADGWRLRAVDLPQSVLDRLVTELATRIDGSK